MLTWPVFLTAAHAGPKTLNKAFVLLEDYEHSDPATSSWVLLTSSILPDSAPNATTVPLPQITTNSFAGFSLSDVNNFLRNNEAKLKSLNIPPGNWLVIDQAGLDSSTCLVVEQVYDYEENRVTDRFRAVRLPFQEAWSMYANLDIANMDFDEWVDEDAGVQPDGAWKWVGPFESTNEGLDRVKKETDAKRQKALKAMADLGHVDLQSVEPQLPR